VVRPSASTLFVIGAIAAAGAVGVLAHRASGAAAQETTALPSDAVLVGFEARGRVGEVVLLEATRHFSLALGNGPVRGEPAAMDRLAKARAIVSSEIARYPAVFTKNVHLTGIVFAEDLVEGEKPIPSLPNVAGLLLLDVHAAETDLVRTLHHEVFHFADLADDGSLTPDPEFQALNARGFVYGGGGRSLRSTWAARPSDIPGFVSGYATSAVEEDKAETFAFMMTRRLPDDPIVAAKAHLLEQRAAALGL
jgi:hypothetical protein